MRRLTTGLGATSWILAGILVAAAPTGAPGARSAPPDCPEPAVAPERASPFDDEIPEEPLPGQQKQPPAKDDTPGGDRGGSPDDPFSPDDVEGEVELQAASGPDFGCRYA